MIKNYIKPIVPWAMAALLLLAPALVLAKDKSASMPASQGLVWLNGEDVMALFEGGFWCAEPIGDTCTFTSATLDIGEKEVTYRVSGYMNENTIVNLDYVAEIADDGVLCESSVLNLDSLTATDTSGIPLNKTEMGALLSAFSSSVENPSDEYVCFGFVLSDPQYPYSITQHEIDIEFNILSSIEFDISFAANAAEILSLRWE